MKIVPMVLCLVICGCASTKQPQDPCADRPLYKEYVIEIPSKPILSDFSKPLTDGEVVRLTEQDLSEVMEYALKLENLIKSLPRNLSVPR